MKKIIIFIIIIIIAGLGYWLYQSMTTPEELSEKEQACVSFGGQVSTSLCCKTTGDFPNLCLIGSCGCSPDNSHQVKVCDCGPDKCFNGSECISLDEVSVFLEDLKQETGIDFSEIKDVEFKWMIKIDPNIEDMRVQGKGFEVERISDDQYKSIESFFENNGFEIDMYNIAAGTISWLTGYKIASDDGGYIVCNITAGVTGYKEAEGQWTSPEPDKKDVEISCGKIGEIDETVNWNSYKNEKYGYSLKYPIDCSYGPLAGSCKQSPPEERPLECRCFLNGEDPDVVGMQAFIGTKSDLTLATISISHHSTDVYNPPADVELIDWLKEKFSYLDIPDEINMELDEVPAVKVYTPQSPGAYSQENIYFIKDNKLFDIYMVDVDNEDNRELYDKIIKSFKVFVE